MAVDASPPKTPKTPPRRRGLAWRDRLGPGTLLGTGLALSAALVGLAVWMASSAPVTGPVGPPSRAILIVLGLNLILIGTLAIATVHRVFGLIAAQRGDAGARLHLRFVMVFATAAVAPAIIVAVVFGVLVNQSVDSWFSHRVSTVVENSATVARSYVRSQKKSISENVDLMAGDLNHSAAALQQKPIDFSHFLALQASYHDFPAAYLIDRDGRILSRFEVDGAPPF